MAPCPPQKRKVNAPSYLHKYPCQNEEKTAEAPKPCQNLVQDLIDLLLQSPRKEVKKEPRKKLPCEDVKPPSKKKFEQLGLKNICAMPYSRAWVKEEIPCRDVTKLPKWFKRQPRKEEEKNLTCPRELDPYEKSLWVPICKPPEPQDEKCMEPIEDSVCVFCAGSLYTGGFIHDLFEKVPLIKKQSEIYGDEIAQRIGIRTRITVHKKCYDDYIDVLAHAEEKEEDIALENDEVEESEDLNCGEEEGEEEEDEYEKMEKEKEKQAEKEKGKRRKENTGKSLLSSNINFCLKKYKVPAIEPGKQFENHSL